MQAEDLNGFQDQDGCPEGNADRDLDGIFDSVDVLASSRWVSTSKPALTAALSLFLT